MATKEERHSEIEKGKKWATASFVDKEAFDNLEAKTNVRLDYLEDAQAEHVAHILHQMQRNSRCKIYIAN